MRRLLPLVFLITFGCTESESRSEPRVSASHSPCAQKPFEEVRFTVCSASGLRLELIAAGRGEAAVRRFDELEARLGPRAERVAFAMNAGMFDEEGRPIGLAIVEGREVRAVNRRQGGGNFHLMPNGIFQVRREGRAEVLTTSEWTASSDIVLATQSGPMLVIDGKMHPAFDHDGSSRHIRNGVGIGPDGAALFAISEEPVSLGKFARFFRDSLKSQNALFFDGAVSALWDPANHRRDITVPLGPLIVAFKPAESDPDREARATP